jgi:hypothetical protein
MAHRFSRDPRALAALLLSVCGLACTPATQPESPRLQCNNPVTYNGKKVGGEVALGSIFGIEAGGSDIALRDPRPAVEKYYAALSSLCDQLNSGVLDREQYLGRADALTHALMGDLNPTGTQEQQFKSVYQQLVPQTAPGLELELTMRARDASDGQEQVVRPNQPVPTGARVRFSVRTSQTAHVYMLQKTERDGVTALYPHAQLALQNPLEAGRVYEIPPAAEQWFSVNGEDIGIENVYVIASLSPLDQVESALARLAAESGPININQIEALKPLTTLQPGFTGKDCGARGLELVGPRPSCTRTRGLVLVGGKDNLAPEARPSLSLKVQASPGDSLILKVFPWNHVSADGYAEAARTYAAGTPAGKQARGILVEDP